MKNSFRYLLILLVLIGCSEKSSITNEQSDKYIIRGNAIADASAKSIGVVLLSALETDVAEATAFCKTVTPALSDNLLVEHGAVVKRTSLKLRNPLNAPDSMELVMLKVYLQMSQMRNPILVPKIIEKNDTEVQYFAPILIKDETCLKCHGIIGQTMMAKDYAFIKTQYPYDEAINYKQGQLRGMWSITLKKE